jgi:hypothetical protein
MDRRLLGALSVVLFASTIVACSGGDSTPGDLEITDGGDDGSIDGNVDDSNVFNLDGDNETFTGCKPKTCADLGANCGPAADGCGALVDCGTCTAPAVCGGGGVANVCGTGCKGLTCADLKATCGKQGDGCGAVIDCGTCTAPETCGGGGKANTCGSFTGDAGACTKKTCTDYSANCGWVSDGCGGLVDCGTCSSPAICGGGGKPNVCGGGTVVMCTPKTCATAGANCGPIGDGCGGIIASCGTCTAPAICGGGGTPSVCGGGSGDGGTPACVGLACKQVTCPAGTTTSISGTVYDPAGKHPLPNVFVYVPNSAVGAFPAGASCDKCSASLSGSPLVTTTTDVNGKFKLDNMPVDTNVPVVIQIGKWRRQITITTTKCGDTVVPVASTHLPRNKSEGDIPKIALTTGAADPLECLLRKIGIDDAEFTNPSGTGRVNLYTGFTPSPIYVPPTNSYNKGAAFPDATTLWSTSTALQKYDVVLLGCEGEDTTTNKSAAALKAMQDYVNAGGRVFGEHYHYTWMKSGPAPWPGMIGWNGTLEFFNSPTNETVLTGFPKGAMMSQWMKIVGAGSAGTPSTFPVNGARHSVSSIKDKTNVIDWIEAPTADVVTINAITGKQTKTGVTYTNAVQYFSFNTPVGAAADSVCGRFVFSDIHVSSGDSVGKAFPTGCTTTTMTPQELALEFMFFDLASRVCDETVPPPPPTCTKTTCVAQGISCGPAPDGCGSLLDCGTCTSPDTCGGGGTAGKCGHPTCTKTTCAAQGIECGPAGDGCGGTLSCGTCVAPATCGGVTPGKCGVPPACKPLDCTGKCGPQGDGCGGVLTCPPCDGGSCTPTTCTAFGAECGIIGDGCGGTIDCGKCAAPKTCGGGGTPYKCGGLM